MDCFCYRKFVETKNCVKSFVFFYCKVLHPPSAAPAVMKIQLVVQILLETILKKALLLHLRLVLHNCQEEKICRWWKSADHDATAAAACVGFRLCPALPTELSHFTRQVLPSLPLQSAKTLPVFKITFGHGGTLNVLVSVLWKWLSSQPNVWSQPTKISPVLHYEVNLSKTNLVSIIGPDRSSCSYDALV